MNIDKPKLVELLVDKTGMQPENVERQLDQLIERIVDAANRGKALEIKDFGLFYFDESGELKFDAAEELSTEISFKYAGMKPVELKPERDSSMPPLDIQRDGEESDTESEAGLVQSKPISETKVEDEAEKDPFGLDDESEENFDFLSDIEEPVNEAEEADEAAEAIVPDEKPVKKENTLPAKKIPPRKKSNAGFIAIAAILLLVILIGGTIWFMDTVSNSEETAETSATELPVLVVPDELSVITEEDEENIDQLTAIEEAEEADLPAEQEPETVVEEEIDAVPATQQQISDQPLYGLRGAVLDEANDGYSIVIHSFNTEETARTTAATLTQDGYRTLVNSRTIAGNSMWRVSVGQFETLSDAQEAARQLPTPYNTQNFIHRIQIN